MYFGHGDYVEYDSADLGDCKQSPAQHDHRLCKGTKVRGTIEGRPVFNAEIGKEIYTVRTEPNREPKQVMAELLRHGKDPKAPAQKCKKAFRKLVQTLEKHGWLPIEVDDGDDEAVPVRTFAELVDAVFAVDEAVVYFQHGTSGKRGGVRLIWDYDMEPSEMTQDYTTNLDEPLDEWMALFD